MWWDRSKALEVYLSDREVGWGFPSAAPARWLDSTGLDESLQQVATRLSSGAVPAVSKLRIWLSSSLAQPFLVPAASGARNRREAHAVALAMAPDATGIGGQARVWLDRWRPGESTLVVAMPEDVWKRMHELLAARRIKIVSVRPWWNLPFDELIEECRRDAARIGWSLADGGGILHGVIDRGSVVDVGFDRPGPHDPTGGLLKRRLRVGWGDVAVTRHLTLDRQPGRTGTQTHAIGGWGAGVDSAS